MKKSNDRYVRVDITIKRDIDYHENSFDYIKVLKRIRYIIQKVEKKIPLSYRFFTFQYSPSDKHLIHKNMN